MGEYLEIVICDDDALYAKEIGRWVTSVLQNRHMDAEIDYFYDSYELSTHLGTYAIAFLDVEMKSFTGIEIARMLKEKNSNILIFFITSYEQYLDEAMDLNAFRYIKKPLDSKRLVSGLEKALQLIDTTTISFFVKNGRENMTISSDDIIYIEISGRNTIVHTALESYTSGHPIQFWAERLVHTNFYQIHKSFIVNLKYVTGYSRAYLTLNNKYKIPIAYRTQSAFRSYFLNYLGDR